MISNGKLLCSSEKMQNHVTVQKNEINKHKEKIQYDKNMKRNGIKKRNGKKRVENIKPNTIKKIKENKQ